MKEKSSIQIYVLNLIYLNVSFVIFQFVVGMVKFNYENVVGFVELMGETLTYTVYAAVFLIRLLYYYTGNSMNIYKLTGQIILQLIPFLLFTNTMSINTMMEGLNNKIVLILTVAGTFGMYLTLRIGRKIIAKFTKYFKEAVGDEKDRILIVISFFGIFISLIALFK